MMAILRMLWFILRAGGTWKKRPNVRTRPGESKAEGHDVRNGVCDWNLAVAEMRGILCWLMSSAYTPYER